MSVNPCFSTAFNIICNFSGKTSFVTTDCSEGDWIIDFMLFYDEMVFL